MENEKVQLRHPHTGDVVEVEATPAELTKWMVKGYGQAQREPVRVPPIEIQEGE